jgi:Polyphosphate kinase
MAIRSTLRPSPQAETLPRDRFSNRELSRLEFDSRVLTMAEDLARPLAERIRFLAIVSDSLDDFFQVRVALSDDTLAWELDGDGSWSKVATAKGLNTQALMQRATLGLVEGDREEAV